MGVKTDTRQRMITSAALLLREKGVAGTSIAEVLRHSRGPRGSVGFHFPGGRAELLTDALGWAGNLVTTILREAASQGTRPDEVFAGICDYYRHQLATTEFAAGCPVGAAAQEAYGDPVLGPVISSIVEDWHTGLTAVLTRAGHEPDSAADLAMLCISALEGAITMSRVKRSTDPIDTVRARIVPMLTPPA
ncbi:TetR/AcrR family transcriptional regulator [Nocardioides caeni]|uniref:TetR/AcrR family transcriptional regulator n=1 Tax=Nocardioides caeni TaxID=574700 RepID=A0A4S8NN61_9ACTN|nr:TetR/AcrR family transcriptional regulator [Nocardioides caeni]THV18298.1 TetR/AcrR family transcriptional regulator [Nocardioides caeni]